MSTSTSPDNLVAVLRGNRSSHVVLLLLLPFCLFVAGCLSVPRSAEYGGVRVSAPPGWAITHRKSGSLEVSMAGTSADLIIEKVSDEQVFSKREAYAIDLARGAYPKEWIKTAPIETLGKLHGKGTKILLMSEDGQKVQSEQVYFLTGHDSKYLMVAACCDASNSGLWHAYARMLESLCLQK
jgi:hypothetical protein